MGFSRCFLSQLVAEEQPRERLMKGMMVYKGIIASCFLDRVLVLELREVGTMSFLLVVSFIDD